MTEKKSHGQHPREPSSTEIPSNHKQGAQEKTLQREREVDVEEDGLQVEVVHPIDGGQEELLVDVESVEDVDDPPVLGNVVILQEFNAFSQTWGLDKLLVVRII